MQLLHVLFAVAAAAAPDSYDVVVYGGTAGGVTAGIQARRLGKTAIVIEPSRHLGGLTSGGLGATDIGNKAVIGGLSRTFYERVHRHYETPASWRQESRDEYFAKRAGRNTGGDAVAEQRGISAMWTFEPSAAEQILKDMAAEAKLTVRYGDRLDLKRGVTKRAGRIVSIKMEGGRIYRGKVFIDATYEGDLMAKAGVAYHVGREANSVYGETLNGVQTKHAVKHQFSRKVDPYVVPGDPASGLLPGVHAGPPGEEGSGDKRVQAYNFRLALTNAAENRKPIPKPTGYDPKRHELLLRYIQSGVFDVLGNHQAMPNHKTDTNNNGAVSSDHIGGSYDWAEADYATRDKIFQDHVDYGMGLWYFLQNDPRIPANVRAQVDPWGLPKDEFVDNGGWPHQLYVREARRMIAAYVMAEANCRGDKVAEDSVGMGAYNMDSHNTQRYVVDGAARNEGDIQVGVKPYPISYRSIVPKEKEAANLLVPVCLSASHIAYGSIRMEPVFMVLGQSAATAAVMAIDARTSVQKVAYGKLRERLLADDQILQR